MRTIKCVGITTYLKMCIMHVLKYIIYDNSSLNCNFLPFWSYSLHMLCDTKCTLVTMYNGQPITCLLLLVDKLHRSYRMCLDKSNMA